MHKAAQTWEEIVTDLPAIENEFDVLIQATKATADPSYGDLSDIVAELAAVHALIKVGTARQTSVARRLRASGATWEQVARVLEITIDAARLRYSDSASARASRARKGPGADFRTGISTKEAAPLLGMTVGGLKNQLDRLSTDDQNILITERYSAMRYPRGTKRWSWRLFDLKV